MWNIFEIYFCWLEKRMDGEFKLAQNEGEENMNRNDVLFLNWE